jgi:GAF domain-containing protein
VDARPGAAAALSQRALELLIAANLAILGELSLTTVLRQVARSARELVGARHASLGVLDAAGELAEIVEEGVEGGVREGLLAVPVKVHDVVYANLHLTRLTGDGGFTDQDRSVVAAFAVTAGIAIENARVHADRRRRRDWAEAASRVGSQPGDPAPRPDLLGLVAETVLRLTAADVVSVVVPGTEADTFRVQLARGAGAADVEGLVYPASRSVSALALSSGRGVRIGSLDEQHGVARHLTRFADVGAVLGLPLHGSAGSHGVLVVARRRDRPAFEASDLELSEAFAVQAATAMELAAAGLERQRLLDPPDGDAPPTASTTG